MTATRMGIKATSDASRGKGGIYKCDSGNKHELDEHLGWAASDVGLSKTNHSSFSHPDLCPPKSKAGMSWNRQTDCLSTS